MNIQTMILRQYKEKFPQDKLKEISQKTGIQITRVFRLFNGAEMKVSELEKFQHIINQDLLNSPLLKLAKECESHLGQSRKREIISFMNHSLAVLNYSNLCFSPKLKQVIGGL